LADVRDGDTVRIGPGVYRGGITIDKNIRLVGAGAGRTVIDGGGPVVTVARATDPAGLKVSISAVTISGGVTTGNGFESRGGGINISPGPNDGVGATVRLSGVIVTHNKATATATIDSPHGKKCPSGLCPYARARGGGIANSGHLTVERSKVLANRLDGPLSDANGGGIFSEFGGLTVVSSVVAANRVAPVRIGRFAEGGGLFVDSGALRVSQTTLTRNRADLVTSWPIYGQGTVIDMNANSGAIHVGDKVKATISHTVMSWNSISAIDPAGEPLAFDSAMLAGDSSVTMSDTVISHNSNYVNVATTKDVGVSGTTLELDGPADVRRSRVSDNPVKVVSKSGEAGATNGIAVYDFSDNPRQVTITDTVISDNHSTAISKQGSAVVYGGGILNNSLLELNQVTVRGNTGDAQAPSTIAQGGGIWNGVLLSGPPVRLTLNHTTVVGNSLRVSAGGSAQGGGMYTKVAVTRNHSVITGNHPDNCFGC
jgi:hypothetical protein